MNNLGKRIIVTVLVLAVIVVGFALWWKDQAVDTTSNLGAVGSAASSDNPANAEAATLTMDDQFPGPLVFVSAVHLPAGGWVVIARDEEGKPGTVVGAGFFGPGVTTGEINLATPTKEGEKYFAILYHDNGDMNFTAQNDLPYRDAATELVLKSFQVTKNLPENKG